MIAKRLAMAAVVVGLMLAIPIFAAAPASVPTVKDPEATEGYQPAAVERAMKGEIVVSAINQGKDTGQTLIQAIMVFNVPLQETLHLLKQTDRQAEYLDACDKSITIERLSDHDLVEFHTKILAWDIKYRVSHHWDDKKFQMWWSLDPKFKNDLKQLDGFWHFYYLDDNRTFVKFGTKLVVRDFIPKTVQEALTRRDLPNSLEMTRKWVNSRGTYRKKRT